MTPEPKEYELKETSLIQLGDSALSIRELMEAALNRSSIEGSMNNYLNYIGSRTIFLYKERINDPSTRYTSSAPGLMLCKFKIDHEFDTSFFSDPRNHREEWKSGVACIDKKIYDKSKGTEFVIINPYILTEENSWTLNWALQSERFWELMEVYIGDKANLGYFKEEWGLDDIDFSVFSNEEHKLEGYHHRFARDKISINNLMENGGFRIKTNYRANTKLIHDEVIKNGGLLELAVGKNNASKQDYKEASELLSRFSYDVKQGIEFYIGLPSDYETSFFGMSTYGDMIGNGGHILSTWGFLVD